MEYRQSKLSRIVYAFKLFRYIEDMWKYLIISIFCNLIFKLIPLSISFLTSYMISIAVMGKANDIWRLFTIVGILVVVSGIMSYLNVFISHDMAYRILAKLRNAAYEKIDEIAPAAMEGKHSGELTSTVLEDVEILEWFYAHTIGQLVVAIVIPTIGLIFMGKINPYLPIILLPFIVAMICVPIFTHKKANTQGYAVRTAFSNLNTIIVDGVQGLKDIISFQWKDKFFIKFSEKLNNHQRAQMDYALRSGGEFRNFQLIIGLGSLAGQITIAFFIVSEVVDEIWLIPMFILSAAVFVPLQEALNMSTNYGMIFGAARRLFDLFQMKKTVEDVGTKDEEVILKSHSSLTEKVTVSFEHVNFTYPLIEGENENQQLFHDLTFSFSTGETVALVGASGSGKTTIAKLLQRFWDGDYGKITINGEDIRNIKLKALRNLITVVPQDVYLFNMSVKENLLLAKPYATNADIEEAVSAAQAIDFINKLPNGYNTEIGERGLRLSGGEKQRLSIAQAFLKNSPILVLDEASANLDSKTENQINSAVNSLKKGRSTLVIAHRISTIQSADRIVVLRNGKVEKIGKYEKLIRNCSYFNTLLGGKKYGKN